MGEGKKVCDDMYGFLAKILRSFVYTCGLTLDYDMTLLINSDRARASSPRLSRKRSLVTPEFALIDSLLLMH